jgi:Flp pilus assembly pilin Flp
MFYSIYQRVPLVLADLRLAVARSQGQALIEYALIISLIAVVAIAALSLTGVNIKSLLTKVATEV